jgi:hypothetical protein
LELSWIGNIATIAIAFAALVYTIASHRNSRQARLFEIRQGWENIHDSWTWTVLLRRGPDDYYADANPEMRQRLKTETEAYDSLEISEQMNVMRGYTSDVRKVARYLSFVAAEVLSLRVSVPEVYEIIGPEVARHRAVVYWLAGAQDGQEHFDFLNPLTNTSEWEMGLSQVPETVFHNQSIRITMLYELLWSEMAKRGDMYAHRIIDRAEWLSRPSTQSKFGTRLRIVNNNPAYFYRRWILLRQLSFGRRVPIEALELDDNPIINSQALAFVKGHSVRHRHERIASILRNSQY